MTRKIKEWGLLMDRFGKTCVEAVAAKSTFRRLYGISSKEVEV